ncbi:hypothetical protein H5986_11750, partial [Fusobacterium mortiferum]|nr:hypothetical protein [Fusobacterium mortiferum]
NPTGNGLLWHSKEELAYYKEKTVGNVVIFEKNRSDMSGDFFEEVVGNLDRLETIENFTNAMSQMSGAIHGYTVDISAINSRNIVNTMRNRAMTRDYLVSRPINSWTQDI